MLNSEKFRSLDADRSLLAATCKEIIWHLRKSQFDQSLSEILDRLHAALSNEDSSIIEIGSLNERVDSARRSLEERLAPTINADLRLLILGLNAYSAEFPEWREWRRWSESPNAASEAGIANSYPTVIDSWNSNTGASINKINIRRKSINANENIADNLKTVILDISARLYARKNELIARFINASEDIIVDLSMNIRGLTRRLDNELQHIATEEDRLSSKIQVYERELLSYKKWATQYPHDVI